MNQTDIQTERAGESKGAGEWDELLQGDPIRVIENLEARLDRLPAEERVQLLRRARPADLERLFELCRDRPLDAEHLVSNDPGAEAIHDGVNSLPLFRVFQKRFFRDRSGRVAGYNPGPFNWATTPGYFTVRQQDGHLFFDYESLPEQVPEGWPRPTPNKRKLGRFVYYGLRDEMRRVSRHVCIGCVFRHGRPIDTWFILCRRDV